MSQEEEEGEAVEVSPPGVSSSSPCSPNELDNPWSNPLDRASSSPLSSAQDNLVIAKGGAYGIVQDVFLLSTTLSVSTFFWEQTRSVVGRRYVNVASSAATGESRALWSSFVRRRWSLEFEGEGGPSPSPPSLLPSRPAFLILLSFLSFSF
ncbi:hypothetical protein F5876DRAFT_82588 [Lentinula aff. lateritia]|uniref:Uncharacterized protein n=1 Tax=Lentinula aff. lateritia TaxID=2804960 RepID=A0ACC1TJM2_9AGAR|nr:hypothetical protein F5876DRAFT_82588 [Lentinula aff. lateritia]